ncbi:VanW family protein [Cryobacterium sp. CG_9.6]|uniref:VanW family protein n=1 Tax=Cryobacterium sp. CG_9.6 TaxID=2760710 RepID=UPI00247685F8|nr:VanW family protein [Cryobacterium sp. CG_9.6]MDH6236677.1 vancomycin resistance protein VanW [Cryobacterium sp. CG_9.6]
MSRRLFSNISPFTYRLSVRKMIALRQLRNLMHPVRFATSRADLLPVILYRHNSLIRRKLGNVDGQLQENKAVNLSIAAPLVCGIVIRPGETFSFWKLVGSTTAARGYRDGLTISSGRATSGMGGGICQFTNLLHWMVLHSPLTIVEHHHHDNIDLFPDFNRQIPFGTGTSVMYNYLDYRVRNDTEQDFQFSVTTTAEYLVGELRTTRALDVKFHIQEADAYFYERDGDVYRHNRIYRSIRSKATGLEVERTLLGENDARVAYDRALITAEILPARPVALEAR